MSVFEIMPIDPRPEPRYKKGKGCLALVASDGRGSILIDWIGAGIEYWLDGVETDQLLKDLGEAPVGISIWDGNIKTSSYGWECVEYETELVGEFRPLTDEEWEALHTKGEAWNTTDWFEYESEVKEKADGHI